MAMALRVEIFPADLDSTVDFYTRVLGFELVVDQRASDGYVALTRGDVHIGAAVRPTPGGLDPARRPLPATHKPISTTLAQPGGEAGTYSSSSSSNVA